MDQINSDMILDTEYDEKSDVAIISPDETMDDAEPEPELRADEFDSMKKRYMPELPDLEVESEAMHTWDVDGWRGLPRRTHGPAFHCGDHPWRVLFFPYGNNVDYASFYLEHGFEDKPPEKWYACAQFMLTLWNPEDPTIYVTHTATHRFTAEEGDWGFTRFAELRKLFNVPWEDKGRPLVQDNKAKMTAYVRIIKDPTGVLWHNFINYDSKEVTGMVGLKNQGATCYLNSLLQSLYFTTAFRKAVYQIPTENEVDFRNNSAYALQRLFYQIQTCNSAVSTQELTAAFGWESRQIFEQQDVQELSRILMERLEEKMKGTEAENALGNMFVGKMKTYISCINVDYESSRIEDFWDVQLNVSGNKNLDDSFKDYIQVETMEGENKYFAEGHGLQDARKGVIFTSFPSVLHLQLKRFEYDFQRDAMMKINDRYEFPEIWDASPYLSDDADRSEPYIYHLHGVLVHSGDLNAGHYYAFLKPTKNGEFFKFDDDRVTRAMKREAMEENFGGEYTNLANGNVQQRNPYTRTWSSKRSMNAYMLVYIRESRLDKILLSDEEVEPPEHLAKKYSEELAIAAKRRKEREEAHLYMEIQVATDDNFKTFQGFDIVPWKGDVDPNNQNAAPSNFRVLKTTPLGEFTELVKQDLEIPDNVALRPWVVVNRQNGTARPDAVLEFNDMIVDDCASKFSTKTSPFRIWMEMSEEKDAEGNPVWGDDLVETHGIGNNKPILLFLKHFNAEAQTLYGMGHFYAASQDKVCDLSPQILKLLGWPAGTQFKLWEEIKHSMIDAMKPKSTLVVSEIQDGDIITVQKSITDKEAAALTAASKYSDAREFYDYMLNRIQVRFLPKLVAETEENSFLLTLSKRMQYSQWAARVGEFLGVDSTHLRFCPINSTTGRAKPAIRHTTNSSLAAILSPGYNSYVNSQAQRADALYYEILEVSLSELEQRKPIKVVLLSEGITKEETFELLIPKTGTAQDILEALVKKANVDEDSANHFRLYEAHASRIHKAIPPEYPVTNLTDFVSLYAERIPEEEDEAGEDDIVVACYHFDKEPSKGHSVPFMFLLKKDETFKDAKERLSKRINIKGKQFEKIKFAVVNPRTWVKSEYLEDDDIVLEKFTNNAEILGLDHVNKSRNNWNRGEQIYIR